MFSSPEVLNSGSLGSQGSLVIIKVRLELCRIAPFDFEDDFFEFFPLSIRDFAHFLYQSINPWPAIAYTKVIFHEQVCRNGRDCVHTN